MQSGSVAGMELRRSDLSSLASGRERSLFAHDLAAHDRQLREQLAGARVLVVGGAGSIGAQTAMLIAEYAPRALHVLDLNENSLVEVVRDLRSRGLGVDEFMTFPLDYRGPYMADFLRAYGPYDAVLSFAAMKHVRSEKDAFSLARMLETNILAMRDLVAALARAGQDPGLVFSVSTDKAANPVSLMGASKRAMEHALFQSEPQLTGRRGSARFANVAFSAGSLLEGFLARLAKGQPLAAPEGIRRYFVSPREAAELSLLSAYVNPDRTIGVPVLDADEHLVPMSEIAARVLRAHGFEPAIVTSEAQARAFRLDGRRWPLLVTPADTAGEKAYEEFVGDDETALSNSLATIRHVPHVPAPQDRLDALCAAIEDFLHGRRERSVAAMAGELGKVVTRLRHISSDRNLDQRM